MTTRNHTIIFVGNPGVGKSTLLNALVGTIEFRSGESYGHGLTTVLQFYQDPETGNHFGDTPGLDDIMMRKKAAEEISKAFRHRKGQYKLVFVVTEEAGRVRPADAVTMQIVLDALDKPDRKTPYGIIINKLTKKKIKNFTQPDSEFYDKFVAFVNHGRENKTPFFCPYPRYEELEDEKNGMHEPSPELANFLDMLPSVHITPDEVKEVKVDNYDELVGSLESKLAEYVKDAEAMRRDKEAMKIELEWFKSAWAIRDETASVPVPVPLRELKELEVLISRASDIMSYGVGGKKLLEEMQLMEKPIVSWLAGLAQQEASDHYEPTKEEIIGIQTIFQFYHLLVPLMKTVLEAKLDGRPPVNVFVSHTGTDKESYAAPLKNYLRRMGVDGVFLDKDMSVGAKGDDEMMWAAVSCKFFWCVLTKEFVENWYPMRELMVGYIRHIQEPGKDFNLIVDCLEMGKNPPGTWMEQIFKIEALKLYAKDGTARDFPANMQRHMPLEAFNTRYERIAALPMAAGRII